MLSTQSSQLRLGQRPADAGKWIVPEVVIQEAVGNSITQDWVDANDHFNVLGCHLAVAGGIVTFSYVAKRMAFTNATTYRLRFPNEEDSIGYAQVVGEMAIITENGADRTWAMYTAIGTTAHTIEVADPSKRIWPVSTDHDVVQFSGTWFI